MVDQGYVVIQLKIKWEKKWEVLEIPSSPELWLLPTWLSPLQRVIVWKVVTFVDGGIRAGFIFERFFGG